MSKLKSKLKNKTEQNASKKDSGGGFKKWFSVPDGMEMFQVQSGKKKNLIDIMPYNVTTKNNPDTVKGDPDYLLSLWVHRAIGVKKEDMVCLKQYGKPCPICEEVERLKDDDAEKNKSLIDSIKGKNRVLYNVIDLKDGNKHKLFETSFYKFERKLLHEAEDSENGTIIFADPEEGFSIRIKGIEDSFNGNEFIDIDSVDLVERDEQYEESIIDDMVSLDSLVSVLSYEEIEKKFFGVPDDEDEEDEEEKEAPKRKSKKTKKQDEEIEEEEEEEKPKKKSGKSKCPHGHKFGDDCDEHPECDDCEMWDECSDA
jgi:hypothetical protein